MANQNPQENNQEHATFYDQVDQTFNRKLGEKEIKLSNGASPTEPGNEDVEGLQNAEEEVRENEDASLQDDSYSFDEANTADEEYHDADDAPEYDIEPDDLH